MSRRAKILPFGSYIQIKYPHAAFLHRADVNVLFSACFVQISLEKEIFNLTGDFLAN